jgi:hypothetical protein
MSCCPSLSRTDVLQKWKMVNVYYSNLQRDFCTEQPELHGSSQLLHSPRSQRHSLCNVIHILCVFACLIWINKSWKTFPDSPRALFAILYTLLALRLICCICCRVKPGFLSRTTFTLPAPEFTRISLQVVMQTPKRLWMKYRSGCMIPSGLL